MSRQPKKKGEGNTTDEAQRSKETSTTYQVRLTEEQRNWLESMLRTNTLPVKHYEVVRVLLMSDQSQGKKSHKDEQIAEALAISRRTVIRIKQRFCQRGLEIALTGVYPRERLEQRVLDGKSEAQLILLACSEAPDGRKRWTLELLADRMVRQGYVEHICPETVRTALKNNELKPWLKKSWCFPKIEDAEFVWKMEDVLDVYCRPYDPATPLLCMDEMGKNLVADKHAPEPAKPGQVAREDYTYEKKGRSNVFIACEPLAGKRYLKVTEQRTKKDWALFMQEVLEDHYPDAEKIVLVMDNLNTHTPASFYEVFEPYIWHFSAIFGEKSTIVICQWSVRLFPELAEKDK